MPVGAFVLELLLAYHDILVVLNYRGRGNGNIPYPVRRARYLLPEKPYLRKDVVR